jgi:hypothetical protein
MNMPDINIIKNLRIDIKKAFDKGDIDKLYTKMYQLADENAVADLRRYSAMKKAELLHKVNKGDDPATESLKLVKQLHDYRSKRFKFHLDSMFRLLELYVQSKTESTS